MLSQDVLLTSDTSSHHSVPTITSSIREVMELGLQCVVCAIDSLPLPLFSLLHLSPLLIFPLCFPLSCIPHLPPSLPTPSLLSLPPSLPSSLPPSLPPSLTQLLLLSYRVEHLFAGLSPLLAHKCHMVRLSAHAMSLMLAVHLDFDTEHRYTVNNGWCSILILVFLSNVPNVLYVP